MGTARQDAMSWDGPAAGERVLLFAPHPDDETLAAGGFLQRTLERGGEAVAVFATDGENNPWTQRVVERRLRVGPEDCARFGRRRRREALAALAELGVPDSGAVFLGLPDQAITGILLSGGEAAIERLVALIRERRPTVLIVPCLSDLHPDHSALAVLVRLALGRLEPEVRPRLMGYVIHRVGGAPREAVADRMILRFEPTRAEKERKRRAIGCHATQLTVHRRKFLSYADRPEIFYADAADPGDGPHPVTHARLGPQTLRLDLDLRPRLGAFGRPTLHLAPGSPGQGRCLSLDLRWRRGGADLRDARTDETAGRAALRGGRRGGIVEVPAGALQGSGRIYVKLERRFGFFDEGGWLQVDADRDGQA